jgi:hypothetical protein
MNTYTHRYITTTDYQVIEHFPDGFSRVVDPHNEAAWIAQGNVPAKESGDRFILIQGDLVVEDPNKASILAAEAAAAQAEADRIAAKVQAIAENLPSWQEIDDAITAATTIAGLKVIIRKMARVLYWLAKDRAD